MNLMIWPCVVIGAFFAGMLQTVTGFGAGIVMVVILSNFFTLPVSSAINTSICMSMTCFIAYTYRKSIDLKIVLAPLAIYLTASINIIRATRFFNMKLLAVIFGVFLFALGLYFFFFQDKVKIKGGPVSGIVCGGISGVLSGLFGIGGPTMGIYMITVAKDKETYYGSTQFLFAISGTVNMLVRAAYGYYSKDMLPISAAGFVTVLLGAMVGIKINERMDMSRIKKLIYTFVCVSGVLVVLRNI